MQRRLPHLLVFVLVAVVYLVGALTPIERALMDLRFRLLPQEASGELVVVEIDARSLEELDTWPWPRSYYAEVIDRLFAAGASEIALDVDLSSSADPAGDAALVAALERAKGRTAPCRRKARTTFWSPSAGCCSTWSGGRIGASPSARRTSSRW